MRSIHKKIFTNCLYSLVLLATVCFVGCSDDPSPDVTGDAVIESYSPESGPSGTELAILGQRFGNAVSNVKVWVNNVAAEVVSVTPTRIYAIVPKAAGSGTIKVTIGSQEFDLANPFTFEYARNVYTYSGSGSAVTVDGSLRQASFDQPHWLTYDKKDDALFVLEGADGGVRRIRRIKDGQVETVIQLGGNINNPRTISMSLTCDTIFIGNDNGNNVNNVMVSILTRNTDFKVPQNYVPSAGVHPHVNSAGVNPADGTLMFYCWPKKLYRWDKQTNSAVLLYDFANVAFFNGADGQYGNISFSADGTKIYFASMYHPYIAVFQGDYNVATKSVTGDFTLLAGKGHWGNEDGTGAAAGFDGAAQAIATSEGNLLIVERFNHWVRQITPQGVVTTYAGNGGAGNQGFLDGDASAAKFNHPEGIAMDAAGNIYVADRINHRIRIIKSE